MRKVIFPLLTIVVAGVMGCDTSSPNSPAQQVAMRDEAHATLERMEAQDPSLVNAVNTSYGYVVFPEVGDAAIGIGGASGHGIAYQAGKKIGGVKLMQASIGVQVGGDTYGELIIFQDDKAFNLLLNDSIEFGGDATATLVKAGAAGASQFSKGTQVYILPKGGLKAGVSLQGQKFHFEGWNGSETTTETQTNK
jgi:lipid-binding SYLF domain-containing protein